ncbi:hypothetical protein IE81DRAFT_26692 [Ceraceosorus guamensis]|uniref:Uncharacterized protein n=1 Tax=Ceraceosorus guamensis TaxID=1522189 RepID=A0A316VPC5_9BASI|nr:hypothetical protein IE81DRAFT_26692 [Ceraceosorus guamensis]PWN39426.1 hypothetical protein IE81DRAFT_26692 [Ceraceosorus guamensis]
MSKLGISSGSASNVSSTSQLARTPSPSAERLTAGSQFVSAGAPVSSASVFSNAQGASSGPNSGASVLLETLGRRLSSFAYLKRTLVGKNVWLGTTRLSKRDLDGIYDPEKMKKRSHRALLVGLSLAPLLEVPTLTEFVRSVLAVISEIDSTPDPSALMSNTPYGFSSTPYSGAGASKGTGSVRNFFSRGTVRKPRGTTFDLDKDGSSTHSGFSSASGATGPIPGSAASLDHISDSNTTAYADSSSSFHAQSGAVGDASVIGMHLPFALDYYETFITLLDVLTEVYSKVLSFVASSSAAVSTSGLPNQSGGYFSEMSGGTPHGLSPVTPFHSSGQGPTDISAMQVELALKMDAKLKKHIAQVSKEIDSVARHVAKTELDSLEGLMKEALLSPSLTSPSSPYGASTTPTGPGVAALGQTLHPSGGGLGGRANELSVPLAKNQGLDFHQLQHHAPQNSDAPGQDATSSGIGAAAHNISAPALQTQYHPREMRQAPQTSGPARTEH